MNNLENGLQEVNENVVSNGKLAKGAGFGAILGTVVGIGFVVTKALLNKNSNQEESVEQIEMAIQAEEVVG